MKRAEESETLFNVYLVWKRLLQAGLDAVLIGASVIPFLIDETPLENPSPTNDVDVSLQIFTSKHAREIEKLLLSDECGFKLLTPENLISEGKIHAASYFFVEPTLKKRIRVDFTSALEEHFPFSTNEWLQKGFQNAVASEISYQNEAIQIRHLNLEYFLCSKLYADIERGQELNSFGLSKDWQDVIYVLTYTKKLEYKVKKFQLESIQFIGSSVVQLEGNPFFQNNFDGEFPAGFQTRKIKVQDSFAFFKQHAI
jgi:hypothetical protein